MFIVVRYLSSTDEIFSLRSSVYAMRRTADLFLTVAFNQICSCSLQFVNPCVSSSFFPIYIYIYFIQFRNSMTSPQTPVRYGSLTCSITIRLCSQTFFCTQKQKQLKISSKYSALGLHGLKNERHQCYLGILSMKPHGSFPNVFLPKPSTSCCLGHFNN